MLACGGTVLVVIRHMFASKGIECGHFKVAAIFLSAFIILLKYAGCVATLLRPGFL